MYKNLGEYVTALERAGELVRIGVEVDPLLEIAEITDRVSKSEGGGKALLFENTGTGFPVLTNMMGSDRRIAMALGVGSVDDLSARIRKLLAELVAPKESLGDKLKMLPLLGEMSRWLPRTRSGRGECQQMIYKEGDVDLAMLPVLKCWPCDGGRFVTLPLVNTVDPDTGARNVGMYRMQVLSRNTTGMHWHVHKTGERHYQAYKRRGERMPVSVCIGGDPAYTYAATAPMPDNLDEYLLAGFLRRRCVELVRCVTNDIYVPADCDFVIEGYVDPLEDKVVEGPFGDHTGFYSLEDLYPRFHVTAVTHRRGAIYPATVVGVPPEEDAYIAKATEKIFLEPIRFAMQPEVEDLYMPEAGVAHNIAIVSIRKSYPGQPFKVASSMWGAGQMMFNKFMLVASADSDIRFEESLAAMLRSVRIPQDVLFSRGVLDVLDHATATCGYGGKLALDLTDAKLASAESECGEGEIKVEGEIKNVAPFSDYRLIPQWSVLLLVCRPQIENSVAHAAAKQFMADNGSEKANFVVIITPEMSELSLNDLLWQATGNCDPTRDIVVCENSLIVDARCKISTSEDNPARWPNVVTADSKTITLVDERWADYRIGEFAESPSLKYAKLLLSSGAEL